MSGPKILKAPWMKTPISTQDWDATALSSCGDDKYTRTGQENSYHKPFHYMVNGKPTTARAFIPVPMKIAYKPDVTGKDEGKRITKLKLKIKAHPDFYTSIEWQRIEESGVLKWYASHFDAFLASDAGRRWRNKSHQQLTEDTTLKVPPYTYEDYDEETKEMKTKYAYITMFTWVNRDSPFRHPNPRVDGGLACKFYKVEDISCSQGEVNPFQYAGEDSWVLVHDVVSSGVWVSSGNPHMSLEIRSCGIGMSPKIANEGQQSGPLVPQDKLRQSLQFIQESVSLAYGHTVEELAEIGLQKQLQQQKQQQQQQKNEDEQQQDGGAGDPSTEPATSSSSSTTTTTPASTTTQPDTAAEAVVIVSAPTGPQFGSGSGGAKPTSFARKRTATDVVADSKDAADKAWASSV